MIPKENVFVKWISQNSEKEYNIVIIFSILL